MNKLTIMLVFGGRSPEHDVSLVSALGILSNIHPEKYQILPVKISREGRWMLLDSIPSLDNVEALIAAEGSSILMGDPSLNGFYIIDGPRCGMTISVDAIFPILHGPFGEDGTVQGLASLSNIPCVGAGVLGSALGMDKVIMKQLFIQNDLQTADFIWFLRSGWQKDPEAIVRGVKEAVGYPCFVKPSNAGSSVGISKVTEEAQLSQAIELAGEYDRKILIEKAVNARELECAILGNDLPEASVVGEIIPCNDFYDYDAKYVNENSEIVIPADIPSDLADLMRLRAVTAFKTLDCAGLSRVDFLLERDTNQIYLNEINTIPGFTPISMYTKLWEASGVPYPDLIDRLIDLALDRYRDIQKSKFYR